MKFVIVGYGRVGSRTANILLSEGHDVTIVEREGRRADRAREEGFTTIHGDGGEEAILEEADLGSADAVAGLTGDLHTNFSVCVAGDAHGCRTVLRVNEDFSEDLYETYVETVDDIIYPERLGAAGAKTALLGGDFNVLADLTEKLSVASVKIPEGSPVIGDQVVDVDLPGEGRIYAHGRGDEAMTIPLPQTRFEAGDNVGVMVDPSVLHDVRSRLRGEDAASA